MSEKCQSDAPKGELHALAHAKQCVAERIEQLLDRCNKLKRASAIRPVMFDNDGEAHARAAATRDEKREARLDAS